MENTATRIREKFIFEYTPWGFYMDILRHGPGDKKRQCEVEITRHNGKAVVIVNEDDDMLTKRAQKHNFADIAFQLRQKGHFGNPHTYAHDVRWYKRMHDRKGRDVFVYVWVYRTGHLCPSTRIFFLGKRRLPTETETDL